MNKGRPRGAEERPSLLPQKVKNRGRFLPERGAGSLFPQKPAAELFGSDCTVKFFFKKQEHTFAF
jgi:hypothetical protein